MKKLLEVNRLMKVHKTLLRITKIPLEVNRVKIDHKTRLKKWKKLQNDFLLQQQRITHKILWKREKKPLEVNRLMKVHKTQ